MVELNPDLAEDDRVLLREEVSRHQAEKDELFPHHRYVKQDAPEGEAGTIQDVKVPVY